MLGEALIVLGRHGPEWVSSGTQERRTRGDCGSDLPSLTSHDNGTKSWFEQRRPGSHLITEL